PIAYARREVRAGGTRAAALYWQAHERSPLPRHQPQPARAARSTRPSCGYARVQMVLKMPSVPQTAAANSHLIIVPPSVKHT
ncbi:MAG: hypothetical protein M3036_11650, partial [Bifidobacteriales bacterium]|nr:hypothetical protein [Bifidobacteriales bacterium]